MNWGLTLAFLLATLSASAQPADTTKSVLAFGPWFKKRTSAYQPTSVVAADSVKINQLKFRVDSLEKTAKDLRSANDSSWTSFIAGYQDLINNVKGNRAVEPHLITDKFLHRVVMQASRSRKPLVANSFIEEARRIHPDGIYRVNRNCKH